MEPEAVAGNIRAKIAAGRLPAPPEPPESVWAGKGNGLICDGCDEPITRTQIEYEVDPPESQTIRFHGRCLTAWYAQRAPGRP